MRSIWGFGQEPRGSHRLMLTMVWFGVTEGIQYEGRLDPTRPDAGRSLGLRFGYQAPGGAAMDFQEAAELWAFLGWGHLSRSWTCKFPFAMAACRSACRILCEGFRFNSASSRCLKHLGVSKLRGVTVGPLNSRAHRIRTPTRRMMDTAEGATAVTVSASEVRCAWRCRTRCLSLRMTLGILPRL